MEWALINTLHPHGGTGSRECALQAELHIVKTAQQSHNKLVQTIT